MKWKEAIIEYQHYLKIERGLSENTIENYVSDLKKMTFFLEENKFTDSPKTIEQEVIQQFIYEISKKLSSRSQARIISSLRSFFEYLIFEQLRDTNPTDLIETPKIGRKLPEKNRQTVILNSIADFKVPVDEEKYTDIKNFLKGSHNRFVSVGRLEPLKNYENILKAFMILKHKVQVMLGIELNIAR